MNNKLQALSEVFAIRASLYNAFYVLFGSEPTQDTVAVLSGSAVADAASALFDEDITAAVAAFTDALAAFDGGEKNLTLADCYTRLFVGPNPPEAAPWESVYDKEDGFLFGRNTLAVRKEYVAGGFIPANYPNVADDHLALELNFVKNLAERTADAQEAGDVEAVVSSLSSAVSFVNNHLLKWIDPFTAALERSAYGAVYAAGARSLKAFLAADVAMISLLLEKLGQ